MADDRKRIIIASGPSAPEQRSPSEPVSGRPKAILRSSKQRRPRSELLSIAEQIAQNAALMDRLRAVIGSNDKEVGLAVMSDVTKFAQLIDPSIHDSEGVGIIVILSQLILAQTNRVREE